MPLGIRSSSPQFSIAAYLLLHPEREPKPNSISWCPVPPPPGLGVLLSLNEGKGCASTGLSGQDAKPILPLSDEKTNKQKPAQLRLVIIH